MKIVVLLFSFFFCTVLYGQSIPPNGSIQIQNQVWMTRNLEVNTFRNGDPIPEAKTKEEWQKAAAEKKPAWCYYNNDPENGKKYGKLYNWYAVNDPRGLAPKGYHIPDRSDLATFGMNVSTHTIKGTAGWPSGSNGDNKSGFNALPGGVRRSGNFLEEGTTGYWWTTTPFDASYATIFILDNKAALLHAYYDYGASVRCINGVETARLYTMMAQNSYKNQNYSETLRHMQAATDFDEDNSGYAVDVAKLYNLTGQFDEGIKYTTGAIKKFPSAPELYEARYDLYMRKNEFKLATADIEKAYEVNKPVTATYMQKLLAHYCNYLKDYKTTLARAEDLWKEVGRTDNTNISFIHYYKALAYYYSGDKLKGYEFMKNAVEADKYNANPEAVLDYSLMLREQKKFAEAKKTISTILELIRSKKDQGALTDAGSIFIDAGDKAGGCALLQEALKIGPNDTLTKYIAQVCN